MLRAIKSDKTLRKIPVIMLAASMIYTDLFDSFDSGCEHYIAKSIVFEKFEEMIKPIIRYYLMKQSYS